MSDSPVDIRDTYGAMYIGFLFSAVLFGVGTLQVWVYFQTHWKRKWFGYKLAVAWIWFLDAVHLALTAHLLYYYLVINYANPAGLAYMVWSAKLMILFDVSIVVSVNWLYVHRVWILSRDKSKIIPWIATVTMLYDTAEGIVFIYTVYQAQTWAAYMTTKWSIILTISSLAVTDFIVAVSMVYLLGVSRTGFIKTDMTLKMFIRYSLTTGCLTSLFSIIAVIVYATMPTNMVFFGIELLLAKLYVNSFVAMLNAQFYQDGATRSTISHSTPQRTHKHSIALSSISRQPDQPLDFLSSKDGFDLSSLHSSHPPV